MYRIIKRMIALGLCCVMLLAGAAALADGWQQSSGRWWYAYSNGGYACNQWLQDGGAWYYFDGSGWMVTGWQKIKNTWYYFQNNGKMSTGWTKISGKWYHFTEDGVMNTGWLEDGGTWYYLNKEGVMQTGWVQYGGAKYYMEASGAMKTGWLQYGGKWYYLKDNGAMAVGWLSIGGSWYYFANGVMVTGSRKIDGKYQTFDSEGRWIKQADLSVYSITLKKDLLGYYEAYIRIRNNLNVAVDRVDFTIYCYDAYGNHLYQYDYYAYLNCCYDGIISAGGLSPSNHYWWLNGFEGVYKIYVTIWKYHTVDGRTVEIPESERITYNN